MEFEAKKYNPEVKGSYHKDAKSKALDNRKRAKKMGFRYKSTRKTAENPTSMTYLTNK